jgi:SPP1 family predicted phage head-tail adaptor
VTGAGDLTQRVTFGERAKVSDGAGNERGGFADKFTVWAEFVHMRGGEAIMAARLDGRHVQVIRVRASSQSKSVTPNWLAKDARLGTLFNIRDITPTADRMFLDFLCEAGVAL